MAKRPQDSYKHERSKSGNPRRYEGNWSIGATRAHRPYVGGHPEIIKHYRARSRSERQAELCSRTIVFTPGNPYGMMMGRYY